MKMAEEVGSNCRSPHQAAPSPMPIRAPQIIRLVKRCRFMKADSAPDRIPAVAKACVGSSRGPALQLDHPQSLNRLETCPRY